MCARTFRAVYTGTRRDDGARILGTTDVDDGPVLDRITMVCSLRSRYVIRLQLNLKRYPDQNATRGWSRISQDVKSFGETAKGLAKNPLGKKAWQAVSNACME